MIKLIVNGQLRDDIQIQTGGTLTQTAEHTAESNMSIKVPIATDDIKNYDYIQIYNAKNLVFAGIILSKNQQVLSTGYAGLDYRMYDLTLASNADLVSNLPVDMSFPAGATITQILKGNHAGAAWYDKSIGDFYGLVENRIVPEGVTVGVIDDYDDTALEGTAYLWGESCKSLLDKLAELTESYWEITNEKVFNFRRKSTGEAAPIALTEQSQVFGLEVDNDSLATYSVVRVVGGEGAGAYRDAYATLSSDEKTAEFQRKLAGAKNVSVLNVATSESLSVDAGYKGIHDNDPSKPVLMSYGGSTLECKDGYIFQTTNFHVSFLQKIVVRQVDPKAQEEIKRSRGGTGTVEYTLEDESILSYNDAVLNARRFLDSHKSTIQTIKFSTFTPGFCVGQKLQCDIGYYCISGDYWVSSVETEFVIDDGQLTCVYHLECSSSLYRDYYKVLFYNPKPLSFDLGSAGGNIKGVGYANDIDLQITLRVEKSNIPKWSEMNSILWNTITAKTWKELYAFSEEVVLVGNYTTDKVKQIYAQFARGDYSEKTQAEICTAAKKMNLVGPLTAWGSVPGVIDSYPVENVTPLVGNAFTASYVILEDQAQIGIKHLKVLSPLNSSVNTIEIPVDIDKTKGNPEGEFALSVAISCEVK